MAKKRPAPAQTMTSVLKTRRLWISLTAILLVGLGFRIALVVQTNSHPEVGAMVLDTEQYEEFARHYLTEGSEHPDMALMNPLYPIFLTSVWKVFGISRMTIGVLQALLDTGTIFLIFFMGRRMFGDGVGLLAASCYALYGMAIWLSGLLLATTLVVFLLSASLTLCLGGLLDDRRWFFFPAGFLMAIAALGRPNLVVALAGVPILYVLAFQRRAGLRKGLILLAIFGTGFALPMTAGAARNLQNQGRFSAFSANGGVNFYIGNGPNADGRFQPPEGMSDSPLDIVTTSIDVASRKAGRQLSPVEASSFWFSEGVQYLATEPATAVRLLLHKVRLFWSGHEPPLNFDFTRVCSMVPVLGLPLFGFGLLAPLGLVGLILIFFEPRESWLAPLFVFPFAASVVLFFVADRFRFPAVPLLVIAAAFTVKKIIDLFRLKRLPQLATVIAAVLLLLIGLNNSSGEKADSQTNTAIHHHNLARAHAQSGNLKLAEQEYRQAINADPTFSKSLSNLGNILLEQQRFDEALRLFLLAREHEPKFAGNCVNIGNVYFLQKKYAEAEKEYRAAIALDATSKEANFNLGKVFVTNQSFQEARTQFLKTVALDPNNSEAHFMLGVASMNTGRLNEAVTAFSTTCRIKSNHPTAWYYLCVTTVNSGKINEALAPCRTATAQGHTLPEPIRHRLELDQGQPQKSAP